METKTKKAGIMGGALALAGISLTSIAHRVVTTSMKSKELKELEEKLTKYLDRESDLRKSIKRLVKEGDAEKLLKCHRSLIYCERKEREISKRINAIRLSINKTNKRDYEETKCDRRQLWRRFDEEGNGAK